MPLSLGWSTRSELHQTLPHVGVTRKPNHLLCLSGLLSVELEQVSDNLLLVTAKVDALGGLDGSIESMVGSEQVARHLVWVIERGKRLSRMSETGIEHGLGTCFNCDALRIGRLGVGKREVDSRGKPVVAFNSTGNNPHPCVVHRRADNAEVIECRRRYHVDGIADYGRGR